jgi:hypothetical protein
MNMTRVLATLTAAAVFAFPVTALAQWAPGAGYGGWGPGVAPTAWDGGCGWGNGCGAGWGGGWSGYSGLYAYAGAAPGWGGGWGWAGGWGGWCYPTFDYSTGWNEFCPGYGFVFGTGFYHQ